jgi:hypothetical protein
MTELRLTSLLVRTTHRKEVVQVVVEPAMLTLQCEECWERITDPEYLAIPERRHGAIICASCYDEHLQECARCLEWVDEDDMQAKPGDLIGIWEPVRSNNLERQLPPGYYRVLRWPFFTQPMIGAGSMDTESLEFVMGLDDAGARAMEEGADAASGPLCPECQDQIRQRLAGWLNRTKPMNLDENEQQALDAVFAAVRALPKNIHLEIDNDDAEMTAWKQCAPGEASLCGMLRFDGLYF